MIHLSSITLDGEEMALDVHWHEREPTLHERMYHEITTKVKVIDKVELHPSRKLIYRFENEIDMEGCE